MIGKGIILGGIRSGSGKTTVTLGLLSALKARGLDVRGFKAGPDFIDAGLHSLATGGPSYSLDPWMCRPEGVRKTWAAATTESAFGVVEGAMGLFDGGSGGALVATTLDLPVLLVVDAYGMADSVGAVALGFREYARRHYPGLRWAGVVFNRVGSESHYHRLRAAVTDLEVLGYLPRDAAYALPSRHLGLQVAEEAPLGADALGALAAAVERHVDLPRLLRIAAAPATSVPPGSEAGAEEASATGPRVAGTSRAQQAHGGGDEIRPRIGVAKDRAFCFHYPENLDLLRAAGAELVFFSPLEDAALPQNLSALFLGGGYPELHADRLSANVSLARGIARFAEAGGCVYAECGGLMYLARGLLDADGRRHRMCGLLPFETRMRERRVALGYREVELKSDSILGTAGDRLRGHEFHYSEPIDVPGGLERIYRVRDDRGADQPAEGYRAGSVLASYIHLHLGSRPRAAKHWVEALRARLVGEDADSYLPVA